MENELNHAVSVQNPNTGWVDRGTPMLTTVDNPYNPFTDFAKWFVFDSVNNYHSCSYVSLNAATSSSFSDAENNYLIEKAIDELIASDFTGTYKKVFAFDFDEEKKEN
jgi:hypothetical protein